MNKIFFIFIFFFSFCSFATEYPKKFENFICEYSESSGIKGSFRIHSCNYEKNKCLVSGLGEYSEVSHNLEAYATLWDIKDSRLSLVYKILSRLRYLTIYPIYGDSSDFAMSYVMQNVDEPYFIENIFRGSAYEIPGSCRGYNE